MKSNLTIKEIHNQPTWNRFLLQNHPLSLFQVWQWGEVQKKIGNQVIRIGIYQDKKLIGIAGITFIKAKRGSFLHVRHGPVFEKNEYNIKENWHILLEYIIELGKKCHALFIRISPLLKENQIDSGLISSLGFTPAPIHHMDSELCWVLDLNIASDKLLSQMRKTTRYLVRQAEKVGVLVKKTNEIDKFIQLYNETAQRQGFVGHQGIREEFEIFNQNDMCDLFLAQYQGKILAGALILYFGEQAIYHHGASIPSKIPASYLLQWQAILEAKKRGLKVYNFWGIAPNDKPNHPWQGITLFKKGFGGREVKFVHAQDLSLSPFYKISYSIELFRKIAKGY